MTTNERADNTSACRGSASPHLGDAPEDTTTQALSRLRARLDSEAEEHPAAWKPEPGVELVGVFEGWREGTTRRGETHPIAVVRCATTGERVAVWCFYSVLREEFRKAKPRRGELVAIRRLPDREGPNGAYRVYRVVVDRDDQADPFGDAAPPVDAEPPGDWLFAEKEPKP